MTQISAYGIGAGRTIAGESDSDEERLRQRRVSAAQRAEQEKRGAAVRERLARAQAADAVLSTQQQAQRTQAESRARETQAGPRQKSPAFPIPTRPGPSHESLVTPLPKTKHHPDKLIEALPLPVPLDDPLENSILTKPQTSELDPRHSEAADEKPSEPVVPAASSVESDPGAGSPPVQALAKLIDDVSDLRGEQFSDLLTARLNQIESSIRIQPELLTDPADMGKAVAALDFLEGYVEAATFRAVDQQKMFQLISDIRRQLLESGLSPQSPQVIVSALAATQISVDKARVVGVSDMRGPGRLRAAKERNVGADLDDEAESSLLAGGVQQMQQSSAAPVKPSKSSLSKDSEKRREETLVSVTVRSV